MNPALVLALKDLRSAARLRQHIVAYLLFILVVIVAFSSAIRLLPAGDYDPGDPSSAGTRGAVLQAASPGLLWLLLLLGSLLVLPRSFTSEVDRRTLDGLLLAPVDEGHLFLGKFLANAVLLLLGAVEAVVLFVVFLDVGFAGLALYALLLLSLGAIGLAALGTLLAAATARNRAREMAFAVLLIPIGLFSMVIPGIEVLAGLLATQGAPNPWSRILLLAAEDALFIGLGWGLVEHTLRE